MAMKLIYKFYAVNSDMKIVCGFATEKKAVEFADKNRYKVFSKNSLMNKGIDAECVDNWSVAVFDTSDCQGEQETSKGEEKNEEN